MRIMTKYVKPKKKNTYVFPKLLLSSLKYIQDIELYKTKCFNIVFNIFFSILTNNKPPKNLIAFQNYRLKVYFPIIT